MLGSDFSVFASSLYRHIRYTFFANWNGEENKKILKEPQTALKIYFSAGEKAFFGMPVSIFTLWRWDPHG